MIRSQAVLAASDNYGNVSPGQSFKACFAKINLPPVFSLTPTLCSPPQGLGSGIKARGRSHLKTLAFSITNSFDTPRWLWFELKRCWLLPIITEMLLTIRSFHATWPFSSINPRRISHAKNLMQPSAVRRHTVYWLRTQRWNQPKRLQHLPLVSLSVR